jgi:peptidoglycan hydrolase-like protein with peptidoglycan-binding domain
VRLEQWILKDAGVANWDPGPVDGDFGPNTKKAVTNFRTDNGIAPANGEVGPKTWLWLWG